MRHISTVWLALTLVVMLLAGWLAHQASTRRHDPPCGQRLAHGEWKSCQ